MTPPEKRTHKKRVDHANQGMSETQKRAAKNARSHSRNLERRMNNIRTKCQYPIDIEIDDMKKTIDSPDKLPNDPFMKVILQSKKKKE